METPSNSVLVTGARGFIGRLAGEFGFGMVPIFEQLDKAAGQRD